MITCKYCNVLKPTDDFYVKNKSRCKDCHKTYRQVSYSAPMTDATARYICQYCMKTKSSEDFYPANKSRCKNCRKAYNDKFRLEHADSIREKARVRMAAWRSHPGSKEKERTRAKRFRDKNRQKCLDSVKQRALQGQTILHELKNKPCSDCGNRFPPGVMDFDHVVGKKEANLSEMKTYSKRRILSEAEKCDIVCANCHRIRNLRRGGSDPSLYMLTPVLLDVPFAVLRNGL